MVISKINKLIQYPNLKTIFPEDKKKKTSIYEIEIKDIPVNIVIGNKRSVNADSKILIFPIYLVKSNRRVIPIGLFEITKEEYRAHMDDIEEYLQFPLLYDFATRDFLIEHTTLEISEDEKDQKHSEKIPICSQRKDIFTDSPINTKVTTIPIESELDARTIREKYKQKEGDLWVQKWLKNRKYEIKDNEGGGDCLFATIRDAFATIGHETTISQLRKKLAEQVTEETYNDYMEKFEMLSVQIKHTTEESFRLKKEVDILKSKIGETISLDEKKRIRTLGNRIKNEYNYLKTENKIAKDLIENYKFMKNVKSFNDFKNIISSCDFWADEWALSTLEKILCIKFIVFSSEKYINNDFGSVLQCPNSIDEEIAEKGSFIPDFYIIVENTGNHYKLIGYRGKFLFTFAEIPYDIKRIIVDKCMQQEAGIFKLISDFKNFQTSLLRGGSPMILSDFNDLNEATLKNLYDENIVFGIDIHCMNSVLPGKGRGEKIDPENKIFEFVSLSECPFWRKALARDFECKFDLDGYKWNSIENYYQANKFVNHPKFYEEFIFKEDNPNMDMALIRAMGGKEGKYRGKVVRDKNIVIDPDFYGKKQKDILRKATKAKYTQNPDLYKVLMDTKNAKLIRLRKARPPEILDDLMVVRSELK